MSVGGWIIEMIPYTLTDMDNPGLRIECVRIWVIDNYKDETLVYAKPAPIMPSIGQEIWWHNKKIFFNDDKNTLEKVGYTIAAPTT